MTIKTWLELRRKNVFKKYSRCIDRVDFVLPDGSVADFYIKAEPAAACIFALTKNNEVILARQFRPGPQKILDELPGGIIESSRAEIVRMDITPTPCDAGVYEDSAGGMRCIIESIIRAERPMTQNMTLSANSLESALIWLNKFGHADGVEKTLKIKL